ncbi:uncharacterized protein LOC119130796 [Syngnathus acus]|uniref:uncharacterized protein LOC119130796 n=1 Tax=Syngnathus acus TaxID=161584 RepID=UPI001885D1AD|nr:uncharacterized protein LOC119130796 [Syngnathus acus]
MSLRSGKLYHPGLPEEDLMPDPTEPGQVHNTDDVDSTENKGNASYTDTKSKSSRSHTSKRSSVSSAALKARAQAVAARAQLEYSLKEAAIMKQKTELEASLHVLSSQKAVAVAEAEAAVYEEEEGLSKTELSHVFVEPPTNPMQRTAEYIQQHTDICHEGFTLRVDPLACHNAAREQCEMAMNTKIDNKGMHSVEKTDIKVEQETQQEQTNTPKPYPYDTPPTSVEIRGVQDITKYLTRRELLSTGLLQFDDHPENYWAWKASFQNTIKDLHATAQEELDLMTKWLGVESGQQAKRIRSVYVFNPIAALSLVWQRLEECYGSPEVVENALLEKIEQFPKLSNRDSTKLRELGKNQ